MRPEDKDKEEGGYRELGDLLGQERLVLIADELGNGIHEHPGEHIHILGGRGNSRDLGLMSCLGDGLDGKVEQQAVLVLLRELVEHRAIPGLLDHGLQPLWHRGLCKNPKILDQRTIELPSTPSKAISTKSNWESFNFSISKAMKNPSPPPKTPLIRSSIPPEHTKKKLKQKAAWNPYRALSKDGIRLLGIKALEQERLEVSLNHLVGGFLLSFCLWLDVGQPVTEQVDHLGFPAVTAGEELHDLWGRRIEKKEGKSREKKEKVKKKDD